MKRLFLIFAIAFGLSACGQEPDNEIRGKSFFALFFDTPSGEVVISGRLSRDQTEKECLDQLTENDDQYLNHIIMLSSGDPRIDNADQFDRFECSIGEENPYE